MRVPLARRTLIELYCYCRQAERSLHRACDPANTWASLQDYYDIGKRIVLRRLCANLRERVAADVRDIALPSLGRVPAHPDLWHALWGALFGAWKKTWLFSQDEVRFPITTLDRLLVLLSAAARPESTVLIALRRDLLDCETLIETRCLGLDEVRKARNIAHFDQRSGARPVEVSELVSDAA